MGEGHESDNLFVRELGIGFKEELVGRDYGATAAEAGGQPTRQGDKRKGKHGHRHRRRRRRKHKHKHKEPKGENGENGGNGGNGEKYTKTDTVGQTPVDTAHAQTQGYTGQTPGSTADAQTQANAGSGPMGQSMGGPPPTQGSTGEPGGDPTAADSTGGGGG